MSRYISESTQVPGIITGGEPRAPFFNRCIYDVPGTYCFTVPSGVCTIRIVAVGGGAASCKRVGPDEEYLNSLTIGGEPDQLLCGHDGFDYKMVTCIRPISSCADYGNVANNGSSVLFCCCYICNTASCFLCQNINMGGTLRWSAGVAGAGTTLYIERCYMSGQSIIGPSGGYADGCLNVTPGCSFTVTVGCSGGTSGFGTFISATGGSVSITQRPKVRCHPLNNSCYLLCGTDTIGTPVSVSSTVFPTYASCSLKLWNSTHCYSHTYTNQCALATLTAGVGTAWSEMCNIIVRSGAAGTIFHPIEYTFAGCLTSTNATTCSSGDGICLTRGICVGLAGTSCNCYTISLQNLCYGFGYGTYDSSFCGPTVTCTQEHKYIERCWGGASAGNYFGNGINQSDYDNIVRVSNVSSDSSRWVIASCFACNCTSRCIHSFWAGPLFTCCTCTCSNCRVNACSCESSTSCACYTIAFNSASIPKYIYGAPGGAGIKSPGTICLAGSGSAPCVCALNFCAGSQYLRYVCTDNVNGVFDVIRVYPAACAPGAVCCTIVPSTTYGSSYWYPEDMRGHSNIYYAGQCLAIRQQPGSGGSGSCTLTCIGQFEAGVLGGLSVCACKCIGSSNGINCLIYRLISNCGSDCPLYGGTSGFINTLPILGGCCGFICDTRCIANSRGMVIVYF